MYGKHDTERWPAGTVAELDASARAVLRSRVDDGYWYEDPGAPDPESVTDAGLTDETISMFPAHWQDEARVRRSKGLVYLRAHQRDTAEFAAILAAAHADSTVEVRPGGPGSQAWDLLRSRREYEYERVELETVGTAD